MNWKNIWSNLPKMARVFIYVNAILLIVDVVLILTHYSIDAGNLWNYGWIILGFQIIYTVLSFEKVESDELGALLFFGRPLYEVRKGLVLTPWLICSLRKESSLVIQIQIPSEPEEIDKSGDDTKGVASGKYLPIRATTDTYESVIKDPSFKDDPALNKDDPLNQRMTLEPSAQIAFKIKDILKFIVNVGSVEKAKKRLRDTGEGVIQSEFAKRTPALVIAHREQINKKIREEICILTKDDPSTVGHDEGWGVEIDTAQLLEIDISKKVNEALSKATEAKITAVTTVTNATAAKNAEIQRGLSLKKVTISQGEGIAKARELFLLAEAVGLAKLAEQAKTSEGQMAMIVQQAREMYTNAKYSILPGNGEGLLAAAAGIQEVLKKIQGTEQEINKSAGKAEKVGGK